jgi:hypothetical protein
MRTLGILMALTAIASQAMATPEAATWRRQTLVGENVEYYFRYVAIGEHPASHYAYSRTLRLEKVRKSDLKIVEKVSLRDAAYTQDMNTGAWSERSATPPPFDLGGYLTRNAVHLPFSEDLVRMFSIDSSGVWEVFEDGRVKLASPQDLNRQIPDLGKDPRVAGIERTDYEPGPGGKAFLFLRIWSGSAADDADWSEDLLIVDQVLFR